MIGLDYSQAFVDTCDSLKKQGKMAYFIQEEGDLVTHLEAVVPSTLVSMSLINGFIINEGSLSALIPLQHRFCKIDCK